MKRREHSRLTHEGEMPARRNGDRPSNGDRKPPMKPPIWKVLATLGESIPPEELERLPSDLARNVDHYLYGAPKRG
jgi:hypothetical protein